jgi:hypothetical protein
VEAFVLRCWILASSSSGSSRAFSPAEITPSITIVTPGNCSCSCSRTAGVASSVIVNLMRSTHEGMTVRRTAAHDINVFSISRSGDSSESGSLIYTLSSRLDGCLSFNNSLRNPAPARANSLTMCAASILQLPRNSPSSFLTVSCRGWFLFA